MTRATLALKRNNPPATNTPKSIQAKTPQEAPQQPKKKNKADVHAKKKQHRIDRIAKYWTLFSEPEAKPLMIGIKEALLRLKIKGWISQRATLNRDYGHTLAARHI
ncbi:hypothetical protein MKT60_005530 [Providencia rettgeri]|nr:hypothetical protein [Providencia rettgeri]